MDFKVRCIEANEDFTALGKIYVVEDGKITFDNGHYSSKCSDVLALNQKCFSRFELVTDKPHICEILGVEVGEKFDIKGTGAGFHINEDGIMKWGGDTAQTWHLCESINHPEKIIRQPQFSEDEKALMRLCGDNGYWLWYREIGGTLCVREPDEMYGPIVSCVTMKAITNSYTHEHPFDADEYLEGLK